MATIRLLFTAVMILAFLMPNQARGETFRWASPADGDFEFPFNWLLDNRLPDGVPQSGDDAIFSLDSSGYTVSFAGDGTANRRTSINGDTVTFDLNGRDYGLDALILGAIGVGELRVTDGILNVASLTMIADGTLNVSTGATLNGSDNLIVGFDYAAKGNLNIVDGGVVNSVSVSIGHGTSEAGTVLVDGEGSIWTNSSDSFIVGAGSGSLDIRNGGRVNTLGLTIGSAADSTGDVSVRGTGSVLDVGNWPFVIGEAGTGSLTISDSAEVAISSSRPTRMGNATGSDGLLTVSGEGSSWTTNTTMYVGVSGKGALVVESGGSFTSTSGIETGTFSGSEGVITVTGLGSVLEPRRLVLGRQNQSGIVSRMDVLDGALASSLGVSVFSGSQLKVSGAGSRFEGGAMVVSGTPGSDDSTTIDIDSGGTLSLNYTEDSLLAAGNYSIRVNDARLEFVGALEISGGTIVIENRAQLVDTDPGSLEFNVRNGGQVTVSGPGSTINVEQLLIGDESRQGEVSIIKIEDGGTADLTAHSGVTKIVVGVREAGNGSFIVTGSNSAVTAVERTHVGFNGNGTLEISSGGVFNATLDAAKESYVNIAENSGSSGLIIVDGPGSRMEANSTIYVGGKSTEPGGNGTLTIANAGELVANAGLKLWGSGTLDLSGGIVTVRDVNQLDLEDGELNWSAGGFRITESDLVLPDDGFLNGLIKLNENFFLEISQTTTFAAGASLAVNGGLFRAGHLVMQPGAALFASSGGHIDAERIDLQGGTILASTALELTNTSSITGSGNIIGNVVGGSETTITAAGGSLVLGDINSPDGFNYLGILDTGSNQIVINDADRADLGTSTLLGSNGTISSTNGLALGAGESITASGSATIDGLFDNLGTVNGPTTNGEYLNLIDRVTGSGSYTGNIRFRDDFDAGNGAQDVRFENLSFESGTTTIELGGLSAGDQHDWIQASGIVEPGGVLNVVLTDGFAPQIGDTFTFLTADGGILGEFSGYQFPVVAGIDFEVNYASNTISIASVAGSP